MSLPACVFAVDHRIQLIREAEARKLPLARIERFKLFVTEAFLEARRLSETVRTHGGLILDQELGSLGIKKARHAGVPLGFPAEQSGIAPLALIDELERKVLGAQPDFLKCLVLGRPDDPPWLFEPENQTVVRLANACERARVPLVLELILPKRPHESEESFERSGRATLTRAWIHALTERGVRPAHWKLEGEERPESLARIAEAILPGQEIALLGKSAPLPRLRELFAVGRGNKSVTGFAVGRTIFWQPFLAYLDGATEERTVRDLRDGYLSVVRLWEEAAPKS